MRSGLTRAGTGVSVSIARDPALVRTVRLVAASVARRTFGDREMVEEVRLAVGEACGLLVGVTALGPGEPAATDAPVSVSLRVDEDLRVVVETAGPVSAEGLPGVEVDGVEPWALLRGLVDDFELVQEPGRTALVMSWPVA